MVSALFILLSCTLPGPPLRQRVQQGASGFGHYYYYQRVCVLVTSGDECAPTSRLCLTTRILNRVNMADAFYGMIFFFFFLVYFVINTNRTQ